MIEALLLAMQTIEMPAPPIAEPRAATRWQCRFTDTSGENFALLGQFPEAPVGWDPNKGMPTLIEGDAPAYLLGEASVKAFKQTNETRDYFFFKRDADGVRYNFTLVLRDGARSLASATVYRPDPATGRGTLSAFAVGRCSAQFDVNTSEGSNK
ncbi:MAG: hypothetical protein AAGA34_07405 [Pseudomonadota bacterium]